MDSPYFLKGHRVLAGCTLQECDHLTTGTSQARAKVGGGHAKGDTMLQGPKHSFIIVFLFHNIGKAVRGNGGAGFSGGTPQECNHLAPGTGLVGAETGGGYAFGNPFFQGPKHGIVIVALRIYISKSVLRNGGGGASGGTPQKCNHLAPGTGVIGAEAGGRNALGNVLFYSPDNGFIEVVFCVYICERVAEGGNGFLFFKAADDTEIGFCALGGDGGGCFQGTLIKTVAQGIRIGIHEAIPAGTDVGGIALFRTGRGGYGVGVDVRNFCNGLGGSFTTVGTGETFYAYVCTAGRGGYFAGIPVVAGGIYIGINIAVSTGTGVGGVAPCGTGGGGYKIAIAMSCGMRVGIHETLTTGAGMGGVTLRCAGGQSYSKGVRMDSFFDGVGVGSTAVQTGIGGFALMGTSGLFCDDSLTIVVIQTGEGFGFCALTAPAGKCFFAW